MTLDSAAKASLAIMCAISFVAIAHLWPWYLVWTVLLAALVPRWWLARFVIGVAIFAAFSLSFWWVEPVANSREWASLVLYVGAVLWCVLTRPSIMTPTAAKRSTRRLASAEPIQIRRSRTVETCDGNPFAIAAQISPIVSGTAISIQPAK